MLNNIAAYLYVGLKFWKNILQKNTLPLMYILIVCYNNYIVDGESFAGLNFRGFDPMKYLIL